MMTDADIRRYAELMRELELSGFELSEGDKKIRLERSPGGTPAVQKVHVTEQDAPVQEAPEEGAYVSVTSPIVGLFYAAPAENAEPYVRPGDTVQKGQTLCIVEAMKLMNEIDAEESGVVEKVCVTNGQVVEFGTELFRIRRSA
ncbi:MAG: acetyl-CoA carboxylase, biotin carboxyl carrier protein [Bacillota bacterium]|jgi:acetyl-CoA carboxylase biotin carboxyl carrier protein|nr:acetyl-CoA carboxylase, biotin carboxyl carrier protein [Bacillota bacterium]